MYLIAMGIDLGYLCETKKWDFKQRQAIKIVTQQLNLHVCNVVIVNYGAPSTYLERMQIAYFLDAKDSNIKIYKYMGMCLYTNAFKTRSQLISMAWDNNDTFLDLLKYYLYLKTK